MSRLLGTDRSFRRLVLFLIFSTINLIIVNAFAFSFWVLWIIISFLLQMCLAPFQKGGYGAYWRAFLHENVYTGFLEWLCRWEIRIRNIYYTKKYIETTQPVAVAPYIGRVAFYFFIWKTAQSYGLSYLSFFFTFVYPFVIIDSLLHPDLPVENKTPMATTIIIAILLFVGQLFVWRIFFWIMCKISELCIDPVFRPKYKYTLTEVFAPTNNASSKPIHYVITHDSPQRQAPFAIAGEEALGLSVVSNKEDQFCIPVPELSIPKAEDTPIPMLERITIQRNQTPIRPSQELSRSIVSLSRSIPPKITTQAITPRDTIVERNQVNYPPQRNLYVNNQFQATYDEFTESSYQPITRGVTRGFSSNNQGHYTTLESPRVNSNHVYSLLSPPERSNSQQSLRPQVSRSLSYAMPNSDPVHFAAFCPPSVSPSIFNFDIWAFLVHQRDDMREEATSDGVAKQLSREFLMDVRRGALVHITLSVPEGFQLLDNATKALLWQGDMTKVSYNIECLDSVVDGQVMFSASIVLGNQVMVLRSFVFASSKKRMVVSNEMSEVESSLEMLPESYEEIAYDELQMHELVGRGNFGDAFRATYHGQDVVVKTIRANEFGDNQDEIVQEFRHEAAVLSLFGHHPNIVPFVGACTDMSKPLSLVTQYVPEGSVEDQFGKGRLSVEMKTQILRGAAAGFLNIHEGRFIHRDIAARNCLMDDTYGAKVCDFGMCRRVGSMGGSYFYAGKGPLKYMAPESLTPPHAFSYQSDVYSFGVMMWETFNEQSPFGGLTGAEAAAHVLSGNRLELSNAIPLKLQDVMIDCFAIDPSKRPSMYEILLALILGASRSIRRLIVFLALTYVFQQTLYYALPFVVIIWICLYPFWLALYIIRCRQGRSWIVYKAHLERYKNKIVGITCRFDVSLLNLYNSKDPIKTSPSLPTVVSLCKLFGLLIYFNGWKAWTLKYVFILIGTLFTDGWHHIYTPANYTDPTHVKEGEYSWTFGSIMAACGIWLGTYFLCAFFAVLIIAATKFCTVSTVQAKVLEQDLMVDAPSVTQALTPRRDNSSDENIPGITVVAGIEKGFYCIPVPDPLGATPMYNPQINDDGRPSSPQSQLPAQEPTIRTDSSIATPPMQGGPARMNTPPSRPPSKMHIPPTRPPTTTHLSSTSIPAVESREDNDDSITTKVVVDEMLWNMNNQQQAGHTYDPFFATDFAESQNRVFRDIPDPTGWVSPTPYSSTFFNERTYDDLSPRRRSSVLFTRSLVQRTFSSMDSRNIVDVPTTRDNVHFTSYAPPCVAPSTVFPFKVWAFLVHQRDEMREEALADGSSKQLSRECMLQIRKGALVHISLKVPEQIRVLSESILPMSWEGEVTHVNFELECIKTARDGQIMIEATIVVGAAVMVLSSYIFISTLNGVDEVQELQTDFNALPETFEEINYDCLQIYNQVGRGHFGDAYRAKYNGQDVVIKKLRPNSFGENQDQIVQEFRHEAAVLSLFGHHPNIVPFVGACTDLSKELCLVTQYLPFGSLEDQYGKALPVRTKARILKDAACGLLNIHEGGFIHRDVAARNCLVDTDYRGRICDFGLCRRVNSYGGAHFSEGSMPLKYLAPESLTEPHSFSYRSDSYSFGVMMWETLSESKPYSGMTATEAANHIMNGYGLDSATIPLSYRDLLTSCLSGDPAKRPSMAHIYHRLLDVEALIVG
ncbi:kinase [Thraustotheca clavata]|uniref:Kinase n=1 Tax=Thraustotheca clavata TaxID=74557 RepID=A0A1V9ZVH2_9STRA|nr:kinase [Thraustotheca clavata]